MGSTTTVLCFQIILILMRFWSMQKPAQTKGVSVDEIVEIVP